MRLLSRGRPGGFAHDKTTRLVRCRSQLCAFSRGHVMTARLVAKLAYMPALPDLELLGIEMDLLWGSGGGPELVTACARDGLRPRVSNSVPADVARTLIAEVAAQQPGAGLGAPPHDLERWSALLMDALGVSVTLALGSGPSYLVHDN